MTLKSPPRRPRVGRAKPRVLATRYELRRPIGAGGMAQVYLAHDLRLGRDVAVKLLASEYAADPAAVERFSREALTAAALTHPNVVAVYDRGIHEGVPFLVMEYVPGPDLKAVLRDGPLPEDQALAIASDIAAALGAAHTAGVVHCDVKPHNVLLGPGLTVKVADFGISRDRDYQDAQETQIVGSAQYVSPEQAQGRPLDGRSDLYGLGAVLFEMLTGRPPFVGATASAITEQQVHAPAPSARTLQPRLSSEVDAIVARALRKEPEQRYQSAADMRAEIDRVRATAGLEATQRIGAVAPAIVPALDGSARRESSAAAGWIASRTPTPGGNVIATGVTGTRRGRVPFRPLLGLVAIVAVLLAVAAVLRPTVQTAGAAVLPSPTGAAASARRADPTPLTTATAAAAVIRAPTTASPAPTRLPSATPASVAAPDLSGRTVSEALTLLRPTGLKVGAILRASSVSVPEGTIISQVPPPLRILPGGSSLTLTVSSGPPAIAPRALAPARPGTGDNAGDGDD